MVLASANEIPLGGNGRVGIGGGKFRISATGNSRTDCMAHFWGHTRADLSNNPYGFKTESVGKRFGGGILTPHRLKLGKVGTCRLHLDQDLVCRGLQLFNVENLSNALKSMAFISTP